MKTFTSKMMTVWLSIILVTACQSTDKLIQNGQYDLALTQLTKKMGSQQKNAKSIRRLSQAFHAANQADHDSIQLLKTAGKPEVWVEIFDRLKAIDARQNLIRTLPDTIQKQIHFVPLNLVNPIAESSVKAQRYLAAKADERKKNGNISDSRSVCNLLLKLKEINPTYPAIDSMLRAAILQNATQILLVLHQQTPQKLAPEVINNILRFDAGELNSPTGHFYLNKEANKLYDYIFVIQLDVIHVSPNRTESRTFTEENKSENAKAIVNEILMSKNCEIKGRIDMMDAQNNTILFSTPVQAISNFNFTYSTVTGDIRALSKQTASTLNRRAIRFPIDELLVLDASKQLNILVKQVIFNEITTH